MIFTIRTARFTDTPALADLLREVGWFTLINDKPSSETITQVELQLAECLADESHSVYVGINEKDILVGYISVHWLAYLFLPGPEGYISELLIHPTVRGSSLGANLLDAVRDEASERGAYRLSALNGTQNESYERIFYQQHGWQEQPEVSNLIYLIPDGLIADTNPE